MTERTKNIDVALIYELWNAYAAAFNDGELERWLALWVDDGIQMPPGAPRRMGKEQIRQEMRPAFELFNMNKMCIHTEEVKVLGDRAYSHGVYEIEMAPSAGGEPTNHFGKFLTILVKQVDGSWKIAIECFNDDTSPE